MPHYFVLVTSKIGVVPRHMFYVYVLKSERDGKRYIGSTNNLRRRFFEHATGLVQSTKNRRPFQLIYYEAYYCECDARKREQMLKLKSRAYSQLRKRISRSINNGV